MRFRTLPENIGAEDSICACSPSFFSKSQRSCVSIGVGGSSCGPNPKSSKMSPACLGLRMSASITKASRASRPLASLGIGMSPEATRSGRRTAMFSKARVRSKALLAIFALPSCWSLSSARSARMASSSLGSILAFLPTFSSTTQSSTSSCLSRWGRTSLTALLSASRSSRAEKSFLNRVFPESLNK